MGTSQSLYCSTSEMRVDRRAEFLSPTKPIRVDPLVDPDHDHDSIEEQESSVSNNSHSMVETGRTSIVTATTQLDKIQSSSSTEVPHPMLFFPVQKSAALIDNNATIGANTVVHVEKRIINTRHIVNPDDDDHQINEQIPLIDEPPKVISKISSKNFISPKDAVKGSSRSFSLDEFESIPAEDLTDFEEFSSKNTSENEWNARVILEDRTFSPSDFSTHHPSISNRALPPSEQFSKKYQTSGVVDVHKQASFHIENHALAASSIIDDSSYRPFCDDNNLSPSENSRNMSSFHFSYPSPSNIKNSELLSTSINVPSVDGRSFADGSGCRRPRSSFTKLNRAGVMGIMEHPESDTILMDYDEESKEEYKSGTSSSNSSCVQLPRRLACLPPISPHSSHNKSMEFTSHQDGPGSRGESMFEDDLFIDRENEIRIWPEHGSTHKKTTSCITSPYKTRKLFFDESHQNSSQEDGRGNTLVQTRFECILYKKGMMIDDVIDDQKSKTSGSQQQSPNKNDFQSSTILGMSLERTTTPTVGIDHTECKGGGFTVIGIEKDSLVDIWNQEQSHAKEQFHEQNIVDKQVSIGDLIISVNGTRRPHDMIEECQTAHILRLEIVRLY